MKRDVTCVASLFLFIRLLIKAYHYFYYICPNQILTTKFFVILKLPNIIIRTLAGAIFVALLVGGIIFNEYTFAIVFSLLTALCLYEFYGLVEREAKVSKILNIVAAISLFGAGFLYFKLHTPFGFIIYLGLMLIVFISELYLKRENPIKSLAYATLGQIYIAAPFSLANYLAYSYTSTQGEDQYHFVFILAVLVFIWVNDTFAYLTGMTIGKHRLFERISPKKSWEGFFGGAIAAMSVSLIFTHYCDQLTIPAWIGFAAVVVIFGTWGDLTESLMKRTLGVKDSGNMIPGHGGILDRVDSTIMAIPAAVVYLAIINTLSNL